MQEGKLVATLRRLRESEVQFILVGSVAAALNGAPNQTLEVSLVYSREPADIDRLLAVLQSLDGVFRIQPERRLQPDRSPSCRRWSSQLSTSFGPLDLLGTAGPNLGFSDLLPHSHEMDVGQGIRVRVLNLEALISMKEQLASENDLAMLPILRQTLNAIRRKKDT